MKNPLRLLTLSLLLVLESCFYASAQWVGVEDIMFGTWLNTNGYGQCLQGNGTTGWEIDTTCSKILQDTLLYCGGQLFVSIDGVQYFKNLKELRCDGNKLTRLPSLPSSLRQLGCAGNLLDSLPLLPDSLEVLGCRQNQLYQLPAIPSTLTSLSCGDNHLSDLPSLPNSLKYLSCDNNLLSILSVLPDSLIRLACHANSLSWLPLLPPKLDYLNCSSNQLTILPNIPSGVTYLVCDYNNLAEVPELPDSLQTFQCNNNPSLNCLPRLRKIENFSFHNTGITCLPNYPLDNISSIPPLGTIEVCGVLNRHECPAYWNVKGGVFNTLNSDCTKDSVEPFLANIDVRMETNGILIARMYTTDSGAYAFSVDTASVVQISIDTLNTPFSVSCPSGNVWIDTITQLDTISSLDFALVCKSGFDLEARSIAAIFFIPANNSLVSFTAGDASNFYNAHCAAGTSGSVTLTYTGPVQFVSAANGALNPAASGNTLTWSIADFGNVNFFTDFNIVMHTDTSAQIGQQVCFTLTVNPIAGDNNPANNVLTQCFTVVASYDPNDKTAYPAGNMDTAQKELIYTIRFQNTGTAEAQHIYITDTLDSDVDASTFQLLAYSHQPMVQLKENAVRFNFPNINLPDSNTNEAASHGYVQYKVKLKPNLPIGTVINNTAYIYFDFNAPVITNTTTNTISLNTGIANIGHPSPDIRLFPNPATNSVTISIPESLIGSTATVSDVMGRVVAAVPLNTQHSSLTTTAFGSGIYFVTVGNRTQKLIIHH